jgi:hypothetical protein
MNISGNNKSAHVATLAYSVGRVCLVVVFMLSMMSGVAQAAPLTASKPASASNFAVLGGTAVTCTDSTVTGDVGVYPGTTITQTNCPVVGTVHAGDAAAAAAYANFLSAYDALALVPCDQTLTTLDGQILSPGVYCVDAAATSTGSVLTLNGPSTGTWIFKIGTLGTGALTGTNFSVVMADGTPVPCSSVTWWVAQSATLTDSNFVGTIFAGDSITITRGTYAGDAFAKAAVTMTGTTLVGCESSATVNGKHCNQGVGNGTEGCDPGNSNQGNPSRSNDEVGGTPGNPGRKGGNGK